MRAIQRALSIDDDPMHTALYQSWLPMELPEVEWHFAYPAPETDELLSYDLLLLDYRLGNDNGADLARRVLAENPDQRLCILTSYSLEEIAHTITELDPRCIIDKSDMQRLCRRLKKLINGWELEQLN